MMDTRTKEAIRYLGYGKHAVDDQTLALISDSFRELEEVADRRIIYRIFDLTEVEADCIIIGTLRIESKQLCRNVKGCDQVLVLGATLSTSVDQLLRRYSITNMAKAVVLQACAAAMLEEYLNDCQRRIADEAGTKGYYLRPRFSPGYGDFSIAYQREILQMIEAAKRIGLTLTDGGMLTPVKSVTAVIGMSKEEKPCPMYGCEVCEKVECGYRRDS